MTPGTWYVAGSIFSCLAVALLIGGILGWLLKSLLTGGKSADLENEWSRKLGLVTSEKTELAGHLTTAQSTAEEWKGKFADLSGKVPALEAAVAGWGAKSALWDSDKTKLQADLRTCTDLRGTLDAEWSKKLVVATEERTKVQAALTTLQGDHGNLKTSFADLQGKIGPLEGAVAGWLAKSHSWESDRNRLMAELATTRVQLEKAIADDKADDSAYERTIADLRTKLSALDQEKAQHEAGERDLTARVNSLQAQLQKAIADDQADDATYEKTIADLRAKLSAIDGERTHLAGRFKESEAVLTGWVTRSATWDSDKTKLQGEVANLTARLATTEAQLRKAISDDKADDAAYEKTIADLRNRVMVVESDWKARYSSLEAEHGQCATRYAALEAKLAAAPVAAAAAAAAGFGRTLSGRPAGDIEEIEGIGPVYGGKLRATGIYWISELLEQGKSAEGRASIVEKTGIDHRLVLKWVNHADLLRVRGVTPDWAELLEASGVDTVKELQHRVPANLQKKLEETNPTNNGGRYAPTVPDVDTVSKWVEIAKTLAPKVTH